MRIDAVTTCSTCSSPRIEPDPIAARALVNAFLRQRARSELGAAGGFLTSASACSGSVAVSLIRPLRDDAARWRLRRPNSQRARQPAPPAAATSPADSNDPPAAASAASAGAPADAARRTSIGRPTCRQRNVGDSRRPASHQSTRCERQLDLSHPHHARRGGHAVVRHSDFDGTTDPYREIGADRRPQPALLTHVRSLLRAAAASPSSSTPTPASTSPASSTGAPRPTSSTACSRNEGFIVITGEIGAGKTTMLRAPARGPERQQRRRRPPGHHAARRRGHAAHGRRGLRLPRQGRAEGRAADHARGLPDQPDQPGQALPADRRRGAEPDAARGRGTAHAVATSSSATRRCCRASWSASPSSARSCSSPRWSSSASASRPPATSGRSTSTRPAPTSSTGSSAPGSTGKPTFDAGVFEAIYTRQRRHPAPHQRGLRPAAAGSASWTGTAT